MKIKEIHIIKFGSVRDLDIDLSDGMNYVFGFDDETKKAVADFIIVMFYGTVNNYREDIREKYLPLDGSDMSGSVTFEFKSEEYVLERVFNAGRYKKDTIILINSSRDTSEELAYNVKPGEYLFGASKDIFFRNTYINENDNSAALQTNFSELMSSLLSNLISTGSEKTSVSEVAGMLNSYCDPGDTSSISYEMREKRDEMRELHENLRNAQNIETEKLSHQQKCNDLHSQYNHEQKKYQKIKESLELQNMINELETLRSSEDDDQTFFRTSDRYNELAAELKKTRLLENRDVFDKVYEKYKRIRSLKKDQEAELHRKTNLSVDLGRYTPKGDEFSLQNIIDLQNDIEKAQETINTLHVQLNEKRNERNQIKESVRNAKDNAEEAEKALTRHEEMSRNKISQAESTLHNSSYTVETKAVNKSSNLVFAIILMIVLIALLIVFLDKIVIAVMLGLMILSVFYSIMVKLGKEKKVAQNSRVDENQLRINERNLRNLRNQCTAERDKYVSHLAVARNQYEEIKRRDDEMKKQLKYLEEEIGTTEAKLSQYISDKDKAEKNITPPDPKFYTIRSEINEIERTTELREKNIEDLKKAIISDLSPLISLQDYEQAEKYIDSSMTTLVEYDKLSEKLSILGDEEKSKQTAAANQKRIDELNRKIELASQNAPLKKLTLDEYMTLQKMSKSLLQNTLKINDEYIAEITKLKIQYNDSTCVANTEHRIHRLEREISAIEKYIKSVRIAIAAYNEALVDIHDEFAPKVARRTSEILSELTKGKYTGISIKSGKIVIKDKDKNPVNLEKISKSTCDLIYFALRIAVAETTCGRMNYPVILDDAFGKLSESKSAELLRFLKRYAEKSQILIFSTSNHLTSIAANEQIAVDDVTIQSVY
ncbi:MAG: hypothetical protein MJ095_01215 [Oscillospiraceae bacterium]|nr:hypothetical protein [Oscillospiraceae bacterium]